jgi:hypothetical protein
MSKRQKIVRKDVVHCWAHQTQSEARTPGRAHLYFRGDTIFSYGPHFPIARHVKTADGKPAVLFTTDTYSVTTARHICETRGAIPPGVKVFKTAHVSDTPGCQHLQEFAGILDDAIKGARDTKKRAQVMGCVERAERMVAVHNEFSAAFKLHKRVKLPKDWRKVRKAAGEVYDKHREIVEGIRARRTQDRAEGYTRQLAGFDSVFAAWKAGEDIETLPGLPRDVAYQREEHRQEFAKAKMSAKLETWKLGEGTFSGGIYGLPCLLRVRPGAPNIVETTKRAVVEREHVEKVLPVVLAYIRNGKTYQRNGHTIHVGPYALEEITAGGVVVVGCHRFEREEIERFAGVLGVA